MNKIKRIKKMNLAIFKILLITAFLGKSTEAYPILFKSLQDTPNTVPKITIVNEELICENGCFEDSNKNKFIFGTGLVGAGIFIIAKTYNNKECCCVPFYFPQVPPAIKPPDISPPVVKPPNIDIPEPSTLLLFLSGIGLLGLRKKR